MNKIEENETKYPDLVRLRKIVNDKTESDDKRGWASFCYVAIALAPDIDLVAINKGEK